MPVIVQSIVRQVQLVKKAASLIDEDFHTPMLIDEVLPLPMLIDEELQLPMLIDEDLQPFSDRKWSSDLITPIGFLHNLRQNDLRLCVQAAIRRFHPFIYSCRSSPLVLAASHNSAILQSYCAADTFSHPANLIPAAHSC